MTSSVHRAAMARRGVRGSVAAVLVAAVLVAAAAIAAVAVAETVSKDRANAEILWGA